MRKTVAEALDMSFALDMDFLAGTNISLCGLAFSKQDNSFDPAPNRITGVIAYMDGLPIKMHVPDELRLDEERKKRCEKIVQRGYFWLLLSKFHNKGITEVRDFPRVFKKDTTDTDPVFFENEGRGVSRALGPVQTDPGDIRAKIALIEEILNERSRLLSILKN